MEVALCVSLHRPHDAATSWLTINCMWVNERPVQNPRHSGRKRGLGRRGIWVTPLAAAPARGIPCEHISGGAQWSTVPCLPVFLILALATHAAAQSPAPQLLELSKQYQTAVKARDAAKVAALYAEDAVLMPPDTPAVKGRSAIQQDQARSFQRVARG